MQTRPNLATAKGVDIDAHVLTDWYKSGRPLFFARIGDGAIECMAGKPGVTCDGEAYQPLLGLEIYKAIKALRAAGRDVVWGDWSRADGGSAPRYVELWRELVGPSPALVHYEALLLMRQSQALLRFYSEVKGDPRRKVYVGAPQHAGVCKMLTCHGIFMKEARGGVFNEIDLIVRSLEDIRPDVVLFGAGLAGLVGVVRYWEANPATVCIHLGSALDPLFMPTPTRSRTLTHAAARAYFEEFFK